jgi:hypothetical protein
LGGAHRNIHDTVYNVEQYVTKTLAALKRTKMDTLLENRYAKLRAIGSVPTAVLRDKTHRTNIKAIEVKRGKSKQLPAKV